MNNLTINASFEGHPPHLSDKPTNPYMHGHIPIAQKAEYLQYIEPKLGAVSQRELAKILGIGKTTINRWALELGYHPTKYTVNENFFDKWNEKSAYILGLIFSDGNIAWNPKKSYWTLTITACAKDKDHLEKVRKILCITKPLTYSEKTNSYRLTIANKSICQKLMKLGITPKKSLTVKFPQIPKEYLKDFIRGVIDGDGNVRYVDRKRSPYFEITIASGSKKFCKGLIASVEENFGIAAKIRKAHGNTYVIQYACARGEKLAENIYNDANLYLNRKFLAFKTSKERGRKKHGK